MANDTKQTLPGLRAGFTRKFSIRYGTVESPQELKFYVQFSCYPDGRCGEIFVKGDKVGSTLAGALDGFAKLVSIALQHGVPLKRITEKLRRDSFEPAGFTGDPDFHSCTSMYDLIAQYLDFRFPVERFCRDPRGHRSLVEGGHDPEQPCPNCMTGEDPTT